MIYLSKNNWILAKLKLIVIIIYSVLILSVLYSCASDIYYLNKETVNEIEGLKMSSLGSYQIKEDNSILLFNEGITALRQVSLTQFKSQFRVIIRKGLGLKFSIRTLPDKFPNHPNLTLEYKLNGCTVYESGKLITQVDSIKTSEGSQSLLQIINDGNLVTMTVNCDTVFFGRTKLKATEYVIIEALPKTEALISGIGFESHY